MNWEIFNREMIHITSLKTVREYNILLRLNVVV